jgi:hypothetical protein
MRIAFTSLATAIVAAVLGLWAFAGVLLAVAFAVGLFLFGKWAVWPRHELPRHRVRHMRIRLYLRLHPGRGHATLFELWRHWSSRASAQKDRYARP